MRPILLQFFLVFMAYSGVSQDSKKTNLQSLIDTELAFARMAKVENTRNAFLHYLDEETVMFVDGEIKIGKKLWEDRKPDSTLLIWQPVFADISASGDFGYTTGPSEYYENRKAGTKAFHGSYITMWKRDSGQDWKMALDIGVYPQPEPTSKSLMTPTLMANQKGPTKKNLVQELMKHEMLYIRKLSTGMDFASFISRESRFLRPGMQPETDPAKCETLLKTETGKVSYNPVDVSVSSAGDMAYVYGKVKTTAQDKVKDGYYLRIYKKENNSDWKLVLDALQ